MRVQTSGEYVAVRELSSFAPQPWPVPDTHGTVAPMTDAHTANSVAEELLSRGVEEILGRKELVDALGGLKTLRVKLGIDPTSPNLHLGRSIPLLKLRDFQELGHQVVFIVGDFTGLIGDTSDKESERPMLSRGEIEANKATYFAQVGKLIDLTRAEFRYNSEWLSPLTYREIFEHADQFSVADFIARENIAKRLSAGKRVSLREVLYPLLQGYDSVAVRADVEIGGTDQRFNLLAGRALQAHFNQAPQSIIMNPLIAGLDGRKMSSSWGNTINLNDAPADMYGKVMSLRDELVALYFTYCTRVAMSDVALLEKNVTEGTVHPRDAKMRLAREIVAMYHGRDDAVRAEEVFVATFQERQVPDNLEEVHAAAGTSLGDLLVEHGQVVSKAEWRRLVEGGGVTIIEPREERITDYTVHVTKEMTLRIGKRRFCRIRIE